MMRTFVAAVVAATALGAGSAVAFDPLSAQGWQRSRPPAAVAYFRLTFDAATPEDRVAYGLALTAPTPRSYGTVPVSMVDTPRLLDLRFNGAVPDTFRVAGSVAWSMDPSKRAGEQRLNLFGGGLIGWALGVAATGAAAYGIYTLVKKNCPAVSTTTGGCVKPAN